MIIPFGFFKSSEASYNYDDATVIYSLYNPPMSTEWTNCCIQVRRSSDNQQQNVFFDSNGDISLSSLTATSTTTPGAVTLATWIGSNSGFVRYWFGLTSDNTIDIDFRAEQNTTTLQPKVVDTGVVHSKNGNPALFFAGTSDRMETTTKITAVDDGNDFTLTTVSNNDSTGLGIVCCFSETSVGRWWFSTSRSSTQASTVVTDVTVYSSTFTGTRNVADQRLQTHVCNTPVVTYYYDNVEETGFTYTGNYVNSLFVIGAERRTSNELIGSVQFIAIFPSDKTADLTDLHADINTKFSIY